MGSTRKIKNLNLQNFIKFKMGKFLVKLRQFNDTFKLDVDTDGELQTFIDQVKEAVGGMEDEFMKLSIRKTGGSTVGKCGNLDFTNTDDSMKTWESLNIKGGWENGPFMENLGETERIMMFEFRD